VTELVTLDEVRAAARRIDGVAVRTPLVLFRGVPAVRGAATPSPGEPGLLIKPESLQPTGSFKLRGAYNAVSVLTEDEAASDETASDEIARPNGVVAHSSGNHGFAVAYAAALRKIPAAIVVPRGASTVKTDAIAAAGAELVYVEPTLPARLAAAEQIARTRGYALIPPFDDRRVIAGQGTIGLEIAEDFAGGLASELAGRPYQPPRAVVVPISGGGLISGIAVAIKALLPETRVIGVEPELAADARDSLRAGTRVAWPAAETARTRADALRVEQVGELTFPHIREFVDDIVTVTEDEILGAIRRLAFEARLVAEPGGAVAVAACLFRSAADLGLGPGDGSPVVAVLSGGNVDPALLAGVLSGEAGSYTK
jgi:threo-3-hydroxy-L-aspartate ammonia-lyase